MNQPSTCKDLAVDTIVEIGKQYSSEACEKSKGKKCIIVLFPAICISLLVSTYIENKINFYFNRHTSEER